MKFSSEPTRVYKANFAREPYAQPEVKLPAVQCPVLVIHGLEDTALLASGLNDTWEWVDNVLTIVTVPDAGHFVQQDAAELVTREITTWLNK